MKKTLRSLAFPFVLCIGILKAVLAKPFVLRIDKDDDGHSLEIGIVPLIILQVILYYIVTFFLFVMQVRPTW
jgi:hypothetical protein